MTKPILEYFLLFYLFPLFCSPSPFISELIFLVKILKYWILYNHQRIKLLSATLLLPHPHGLNFFNFSFQVELTTPHCDPPITLCMFKLLT